MTVEELKETKGLFEVAIANLICSLEKDTGSDVSGIELIVEGGIGGGNIKNRIKITLDI